MAKAMMKNRAPNGSTTKNEAPNGFGSRARRAKYI
jgi:hypothetical protein